MRACQKWLYCTEWYCNGACDNWHNVYIKSLFLDQLSMATKVWNISAEGTKTISENSNLDWKLFSGFKMIVNLMKTEWKFHNTTFPDVVFLKIPRDVLFILTKLLILLWWEPWSCKLYSYFLKISLTVHSFQNWDTYLIVLLIHLIWTSLTI